MTAKAFAVRTWKGNDGRKTSNALLLTWRVSPRTCTTTSPAQPTKDIAVYYKTTNKTRVGSQLT